MARKPPLCCAARSCWVGKTRASTLRGVCVVTVPPERSKCRSAEPCWPEECRRSAVGVPSQLPPLDLRLIERPAVAPALITCADWVIFVAPTGPTRKCGRVDADLYEGDGTPAWMLPQGQG